MKNFILALSLIAITSSNAFPFCFEMCSGGTTSGGASSLAEISDWPAAVSATEVGYLDGLTNTLINLLAAKSATTHNHDATYLGIAAKAADADTLDSHDTSYFQTAISFGANVQAALSIAVGSAGSPVVNGGALGIPSSGTLTNCTFPTLNQNTTGSAATLTTARNIGDASFNGSAAITADAMLDNEDISPSAGTWDLSALTALTLPSFTGGSTTPGVTFNDTDAAATGTATLSVDAVTAGQDSILQIRVDDSAGEDTVYIEVDGVAEDVEINKPLALSANSVTTTGIITGGAATPVIDDPDNFAANFTGSNLYGGTFIANAAGTAALPNPVVGMNFTYVMEGANANIIDPLTTGTADTIYMNGLAAAQDENITSSTSGAICTFQYRSADAWMATCNGFAEASPP